MFEFTYPFKIIYTMEESQGTSAPKRRPNFSNEEIFAILLGVSDRKILLVGKLYNMNTAKLKMRGWEEVSIAVNTVHRSKNEIFRLSCHCHHIIIVSA